MDRSSFIAGGGGGGGKREGLEDFGEILLDPPIRLCGILLVPPSPPYADPPSVSPENLVISPKSSVSPRPRR